MIGKLSGINSISKPPFIKTNDLKTNDSELIPGGLILHADLQGHFRGTVLINNVLMPFMIDTGATNTAIPYAMAQAIGLSFGRSFQAKTAGGFALSYETHIESLKIGTAEIKNLDAIINPYLDEVLIGMDTLDHFRMTKEVNTLTLVAFAQPEQMAAIEQGLSVSFPVQNIPIPAYQVPIAFPETPPYQSTTKWKKTVICEGSKCKTLYDKAK